MSYKHQKRANKKAILIGRGARRAVRLSRIAKPYKRPAFKPMTADSIVMKRLERWASISEQEHEKYPSLQLETLPRQEILVEHDEEYVRREEIANRIAEERKKMVAPLYNKGGYQYIGDAPKEIIQNLGRKI